MFRCRWCPQGFCEDCLDWDKTELIGENLPEFEVMGEDSTTGGFYIKCPTCVDESEEQKAWVENKEKEYKNQHDSWLQEREEMQRQLNEYDANGKQESEHYKANMINAKTNSRLPQLIETQVKHENDMLIEDDDVTSPPALTDTSLPTPALGGSRVGTPMYTEPAQNSKKANKRGEAFGETRAEKRARLDTQS